MIVDCNTASKIHVMCQNPSWVSLPESTQARPQNIPKIWTGSWTPLILATHGPTSFAFLNPCNQTTTGKDCTLP